MVAYRIFYTAQVLGVPFPTTQSQLSAGVLPSAAHWQVGSENQKRKQGFEAG